MTFVAIPMGRFLMGSDVLAGQAEDDEGPARLVTVGSFSIGANPVRQGEFARFVEATRYETTAEREGTSFVISGRNGLALTAGVTWRDGDPEAAVLHVSWFDATEYCRWANMSLPTEAQWERGGLEADFSAGRPRIRLRADASQPPRLEEWCHDFYSPDFHRTEQRVNPTGPISGTDRVTRSTAGRITSRGHQLPDMSSDALTFRVVKGRT